MPATPQWLNPSRPLKRWPYAALGVLLFGLKFNLDKWIGQEVFHRRWYVIDYFAYLDLVMERNNNPLDSQFGWTLALTALPFIAIGTLLTLRRLRDAGLPGWAVCFFFFPLLNLIFFGMLCLLPSRESEVLRPEAHRRRWLDRWMPAGERGSAALAMLFTGILGTAAAWFSISVMGEYGWTLFLGIPFMQGLAAALLYGYRSPRTLGKCLGVALLSVTFLAVLILLLAVEGLFCILMATPLAIPIASLGAVLGYHIQQRRVTGASAAFVLFAALPLVSGVEHQSSRQPGLVPLTTEVIIDRPRQEVWNQLVTFHEMEAPREWIFRSGIAYPVKAIIEGKGPGSIRRCRFTTGDFVEPITVWDEPNLLQFSVQEMPPPLVEWSLYNDLHLPHLEGYFVSEKGQFQLTTLPSGRTLLQGTTWYRHNIWPRTYWRIWSDYILHTIHRRVLNHIKQQAERTSMNK